MTGIGLPRYEVTEDGKMAMYMGDRLIDVHEVPEAWEYEAAAARQRGDYAEADRILAAAIESSMSRILDNFDFGIDANNARQ